jgi:hypothetical protein
MIITKNRLYLGTNLLVAGSLIWIGIIGLLNANNLPKSGYLVPGVILVTQGLLLIGTSIFCRQFPEVSLVISSGSYWFMLCELSFVLVSLLSGNFTINSNTSHVLIHTTGGVLTLFLLLTFFNLLMIIFGSKLMMEKMNYKNVKESDPIA